MLDSKKLQIIGICNERLCCAYSTYLMRLLHLCVKSEWVKVQRSVATSVKFVDVVLMECGCKVLLVSAICRLVFGVDDNRMNMLFK